MRSGGAGETPTAADACVNDAFNVATVDDQGGGPGISCAPSATLQHWRRRFPQAPHVPPLLHRLPPVSLFCCLSCPSFLCLLPLRRAALSGAREYFFPPLEGCLTLKKFLLSFVCVLPSFLHYILTSLPSLWCFLPSPLPSFGPSFLRSFLPDVYFLPTDFITYLLRTPPSPRL